MTSQYIQGMVQNLKEGGLSRRSFIQKMAALGITAPIASQILAWNDVAMANATLEYKPTKAGGGGPLKMLLWQAPTLLNPHFASGTKDQIASRVFYEPLAGWDKEGNLIPQLAAEVPSKANGGLSEDGTSVTWKLKKDVKWHDGKPFTADDVVFTWEYAADPATAAYTTGAYKDIKVEKVDDFTVKVIFAKPTPFWADPFVGVAGMIIPKHHFGEYKGAKSREAPANLKPVGTGPYKFVDFKPGDIVSGIRSESYHVKNQPHFDTFEIKGGGDAVSAARAVLQTGEYDYAWDTLVEDEVLKRMEMGGRGKISAAPAGDIEFVTLNTTDPWTEVDGERSSVKTKHPTLSDPAVRQAINLLIDRDSIQKFIYGRAGAATPEGPGHHQAGLPARRHRYRAEVGHGLGVLLVGRCQPRHLHQALRRHRDVHHDAAAARSGALPQPVHLVGSRQQGEQVAGPQRLALHGPGCRRGLQGRPEGARSGQARRVPDQGQRDLLRGQRHPADPVAQEGRRRVEHPLA
jgi:peptide/nickel transport system substrate-binding protein